MSRYLFCVVALLALTLIACPSAKPKPDQPATPKLAIAQDLRADFESSDTVMIARLKTGPWAGIKPLATRVSNFPFIPFTFRAAINALTDKGIVEAFASTQGEPPEDVKRAIAMIDTKRDIFIRLAQNSEPDVLKALSVDSSLVTLNDLAKTSSSTTLYIPTQTPQEFIKAVKGRIGSHARNSYKVLSGYVVISNRHGTIGQTTTHVPLRATPATVEFFNKKSFAALYVKPERLRGASMEQGLHMMSDALQTAMPEYRGELLAAGLQEVLSVPLLSGRDVIEFEDHAMSLRAAGKDSVVIDSVGTHTKTGRAVFQALNTKPVSTTLPEIALSEAEQRNLLLSSDGAFNFPQLLKHLRETGALPANPPGTRTFMRHASHSGMGAAAAMTANPGYLITRFFHEGARLRRAPLESGRVRIWKSEVTGKLPGMSMALSFRGNQASALAIETLARETVGKNPAIFITHKVTSDTTFLLLMSTKPLKEAFGKETPVTHNTGSMSLNLENFPPGITPFSPGQLGKMRASFRPTLGASYGRFEFVGRNPQIRELPTWSAAPVEIAGHRCQTALTHATQKMLLLTRNTSKPPENAPLLALEKAADTCIKKDPAGADAYKAIKINANRIYGVLFQHRKDKTKADEYYKKACEMGSKKACKEGKDLWFTPDP